MEYWLPILFFLTATFYGAAGFGGGSTYLAILASFLPDAIIIRTVAYLCNMLVTGKGSITFIRKGWIGFRDFWPWLIGSIPFAMLGGSIELALDTYLKLLGAILLIAAVWMWIFRTSRKSWGKLRTIHYQIGVGAMIGFLSGLVGIGGGIFLAPILHLSGDYNQKEIPGLTSIFILVNTLFGASVFWLINGFNFPKVFIWCLIAVIVGAFVGHRFTTQERWKNMVRLLSGVIIAIVGIRLILS